MDDVRLIQTVLNLTGFDIVDCFCYVHRNCASLRVRHQALRAKHTTQTANNAHHVRRSNCNVKTKPVFILDLRNQILCSYEIRAGCKSLFSLVALREYQNTNCFACAVWKNNGATHLLISMSAVNAQTNMRFYCCVKLRCRCFLHQINRVCCIIKHCLINELCSLAVFFSSFHFRDLLMW